MILDDRAQPIITTQSGGNFNIILLSALKLARLAPLWITYFLGSLTQEQGLLS